MREQQLKEIIQPALEDMGYALVSVSLDGRDGSKVLSVMIEPADRSGTVGVDECAKISRTVSTLLDVEDPIEGQYRLEVGSPGIDRPLFDADDFRRFEGFHAKIQLLVPVDVVSGRKSYQGKIVSVSEDGKTVMILMDNEEHELPIDGIQRAKLVLTDELLAAGKKKAEN